MDINSRKMKNYASFSDWKLDQSESNQELIFKLEELVGTTAPQLKATVKWGQGCWLDEATPIMYIHTEHDHIQLGFYNGSSFIDPKGLLSGKAKYVRFVKMYSSKDIEIDDIVKLIQQAVGVIT